MHGLACAGISVTAWTSCSLFPSSSSTILAKVDILAFSSSPMIYRWPMSISFPGIWFVPSFGGLSDIVEEVHGFIWILAEEVPSTHGLQELFHGRGHSIVEVVYQHPCVKAMVWACIDGFKIPFPAPIKFSLS